MDSACKDGMSVLDSWSGYAAKRYPYFVASWTIFFVSFIAWALLLHYVVNVLERRGLGGFITFGFIVYSLAVLFFPPAMAKEESIPACPGCGFKPLFGKPFIIMPFKKYFKRGLCPCCLYNFRANMEASPVAYETVLESWKEFAGIFGKKLQFLSRLFHVSFYCTALAFPAYAIWPAFYCYYAFIVLPVCALSYISYSLMSRSYARKNVAPCPCCHKLSPIAFTNTSFSLHEMIESKRCPICATRLDRHDMNDVLLYWREASGQIEH